MTERTEGLVLEEKTKIVDAWVTAFEERKLAPPLDRIILRDVLVSFGANTEISPKPLADLAKENYSNASRAKAMKAVWGERFKEFKGWVGEFARGYKERTGRELPKLSESGRRNAGMIAFLGELTAFALGDDETYPFGTFFIRLSQRALSGYVREMGLTEREYRFHILVPGYNTIKYRFTELEEIAGITLDREGELPFSPAGFPSGFALAAWEKIKTWRK